MAHGWVFLLISLSSDNRLALTGEVFRGNNLDYSGILYKVDSDTIC